MTTLSVTTHRGTSSQLKDKPRQKYQHYINAARRDALLWDGGGKLNALCGRPITVSFHDATFGRGKSAQLPICARCQEIYNGLAKSGDR